MGGDSGIERVSPAGSCTSLVQNTVEDIAAITLDNRYFLPSVLSDDIFSFSPRMETSDENQNAIIGDNMEKISKFNRDAKINPDNSVLVEVSLTAEQFELVKSGRYIVSLCDPNSMNNNSEVLSDPRLKLNNWKAKQRTSNVQRSQPTKSTPSQSTPSLPSYDAVYEGYTSHYSQNYSQDQQRNQTAQYTRPTARAIPINRKQTTQHPFSPLSSESSGVGQSYSPPDNTNQRTDQFEKNNTQPPPVSYRA